MIGFVVNDAAYKPVDKYEFAEWKPLDFAFCIGAG